MTETDVYKERDRQYHMDAINRLSSFLALSGTSFEVVQAAIDNMTRLAKELQECRDEFAVQCKAIGNWREFPDAPQNKPAYVNRCPHEWYQGVCIHCDIGAVKGRPAERPGQRDVSNKEEGK